MRCKQAIALSLVVATVAAGCGESESKRAVDARTEVLRFYSVDAPAVAVFPANPPQTIADFDRAVSSLPAWERLRATALDPLHAAGLSESDLNQLAHPHDQISGVDAAAMALGAPTADSLSAGEPLLVFATDQSDLLSEQFGASAKRGDLRSAGELDDAELYENADAAYAIRDGVLVSAPRMADVREAIERRDGDSDRQLDEDVVRSLFDEPGIAGPLLVYADLRSAREADPGLAELAGQEPWLSAAGRAAASARPVGNALQLDVVVQMDGSVDPSQQPFDAASASFSVQVPDLASLGIRPSDPLRSLIAGLAPFDGEGTSTSDEVRMRAEVSP
jgi:hypothetical protein